MATKNITSLQVSPKTLKRLKALKRGGEDYEALLQRAIDFLQEKGFV